ncbi:unnamed protein product [Symbiodinium sp. CCMP2592]|nr:unnamed protein product [Symbiodinium sp. CCMP2592]
MLQGDVGLSDEEPCAAPPVRAHAVDTLSDDEDVRPSASEPASGSKPSARKRKAGALRIVLDSERSRLGRVVQKACRCRARKNCLQQFQPPELQKQLLDLRCELKTLDKRDADQKVFDMLQGPGCVGRAALATRQRKLLGRDVCHYAFRILLGIGSTRFRTLRKAALNSEPCPVDGRFVGQKFTMGGISRQLLFKQRGLVTQFLQEQYDQCAEPMPTVSRGGRTQPLTDGHRAMRFRRHRGRRPKLATEQQGLARSSDPARFRQMRYLPPGTFKDYHNLMKARMVGTETPPSLKLFRLVWRQSFHQCLAIREHSAHGKCNTCVRHKAILKKLSRDRVAHAAQMQLYNVHLRRQYNDRVVYWKARAQSRAAAVGTNGYQTICLIVDGMDKSKFRWPRSLAMEAKEFSNFVRPNIELVACIVHGHTVVLATSEQWVCKDSSAMADIILHSLGRLTESGIDLRQCEILCQADNTARESKNNTIVRLLAALVAAKKVGRAEARFLQSGHSHEDVDGFFGHVAAMLEENNELHLPCDFRHKLQAFLDQPQARSSLKSKRQSDHGVKLIYLLVVQSRWSANCQASAHCQPCLFDSLFGRSESTNVRKSSCG